MKKCFLLSLMVLAFPVFLRAQESTALPFMAIDRNPATSAMGGAQATSALYNPAATPLTGSDVVVSYQSWAPATVKTNNINLLGGLKLGKLGINLQAAYQAGAAYDLFDATGTARGSFTPSDLLVGVGVGFAFTESLSAGLNVKYAQSTLASDYSNSAVAGDLFVMYAQGGLKATAGVASLGTPVKSGEVSYPIPGSVKAGVFYDLPFGSSAVNLAADFDYFLIGGIGLGVGAQYDWNKMVFVRAGYHLGSGKSPIPSYASVGLGFRFAGFHVDASYLTASSALGNTLSVGVGYAF